MCGKYQRCLIILKPLKLILYPVKIEYTSYVFFVVSFFAFSMPQKEGKIQIDMQKKLENNTTAAYLSRVL